MGLIQTGSYVTVNFTSTLLLLNIFTTSCKVAVTSSQISGFLLVGAIMGYGSQFPFLLNNKLVALQKNGDTLDPAKLVVG